jgi:serine/threonine protein phosphatase PrpC
MKTDNSDVDTVELPAPTIESEMNWPDSGSSQMQVDVASTSHQGLVRSKNEDHYLVVRFGRVLETLSTNLPGNLLPPHSEKRGYGMVVADGMGGTASGETASRMAIARLMQLVLTTPDWILSTREADVARQLQRMADRFRQIDASLRRRGKGDPALEGMGTTMTLACSLGATAIIGHIGDSRAYLCREGSLHQLTRDHTLVQALVDLGKLSPEEAARHSCRNVLTCSLGAGDYRSEGDFQRVLLADGDQLLICTDGLTKMVEDATIATILTSAATAAAACEQLVGAALNNGGKDNVTVALARYRFGY